MCKFMISESSLISIGLSNTWTDKTSNYVTQEDNHQKYSVSTHTPQRGNGGDEFPDV